MLRSLRPMTDVQSLAIALPPGLLPLLRGIRDAAGRPYLVGGAVRDALLGEPLGDLDLEVFGLGLDELRSVLARFGRVDEVGRAFSVFKLSGLAGVAAAVEVSLPRRDSKAGPGHRGIAVTGDPSLSVEEASRAARLHDQRAALRSLQRAACSTRTAGAPTWPRAGCGRWTPRASARIRCARCGPCSSPRASSCRSRPRTARLCASMPLAELPAERVFGEIEKLLLARRPSLGLAAAEGVGPARRRGAGAGPARGDAAGSRMASRGRRLDAHAPGRRPGRAAGGRSRAAPRARCDARHAVPRPGQARHHGRRRRPRALSRARGGRACRRPSRCSSAGACTRWAATTCAAQVLALVAHHLKPGELYKERERVSDGAIRRLARKCEPALLYRVARADCLGRAPASSLPSRWSGSWSGSTRSRWPSSRRSRCSRAATCWSWACAPGPRWAASCARSTSASSTAPSHPGRGARRGEAAVRACGAGPLLRPRSSPGRSSASR